MALISASDWGPRARPIFLIRFLTASWPPTRAPPSPTAPASTCCASMPRSRSTARPSTRCVASVRSWGGRRPRSAGGGAAGAMNRWWPGARRRRAGRRRCVPLHGHEVRGRRRLLLRDRPLPGRPRTQLQVGRRGAASGRRGRGRSAPAGGVTERAASLPTIPASSRMGPSTPGPTCSWPNGRSRIGGVEVYKGKVIPLRAPRLRASARAASARPAGAHGAVGTVVRGRRGRISRTPRRGRAGPHDAAGLPPHRDLRRRGGRGRRAARGAGLPRRDERGLAGAVGASAAGAIGQRDGAAGARRRWSSAARRWGRRSRSATAWR